MQTDWGQLFLYAQYRMFTFVPNYKYCIINLYLKKYENNEVFVIAADDGGTECVYGKLWG